MASIKHTLYSANVSLILICVQLITSTQQQWSVDDDGCRTPDGDVGSCLPINECEPVTNFMNNSALSTDESIQTLKGYYCGVLNNSFKVCCPNKPIITTALSLKARTITEDEPPDVTNHKNLNLLPSECGLQFGSPRVKGGKNAVLFEFPWMALLSYETRKGQEFRCGGTIINERYILTAAHCITHLAPLKLIGVRVGEYNISSELDCEDEDCAPPVQDFLIEEVIPHPLYNFTTYTSDIGLIRLTAPIDLSVDSAKSICLPLGNEVRNRKLDDSVLMVTGWGATETGRKLNVLQKLHLPVVLEESCHKAYEKTAVVINAKQICAGGRRRMDSCEGDSGGPLKMSLFYNDDIRFVQFGIVSYGPRLCGRQEGIPSVYTRVNYYTDWILNNMKS